MNTDPYDRDGRNERGCMLLMLAIFVIVVLLGMFSGFLSLITPDTSIPQ